MIAEALDSENGHSYFALVGNSELVGIALMVQQQQQQQQRQQQKQQQQQQHW